MEFKEKFLDRIEQSFLFLKDNYKVLYWPMIVYLSLYILNHIFLNSILFFADYSNNWFKSSINYNLIWISFLYLIFNLLVIIVIELWFIKNIKDVLDWTKQDIFYYINYWISYIIKSFSTYYYIFLYVYLIPAIIFIIGLFVILYWTISWDIFNYIISKQTPPNTQILIIWAIIIIVAIFAFLFFAIYRWTKARFAIYQAIDKDDFSKNSFTYSISLSNDKFARVFWNMFFVWIMTSLVLWILWQVWWIIDSLFNLSWGSINEIVTSWNKDIKKILANAFMPNFLWLTSNITSSLSMIFLSIFIFIFYKRLEQENDKDYIINKQKQISENSVDL